MAPGRMAGNDNMEKLHIIMLFKANFNNNNKWLGHQVMKMAEAHRLLAPEQYGSRKCKAAGTQCLNKWFSTTSITVYEHQPCSVLTMPKAVMTGSSLSLWHYASAV